MSPPYGKEIRVRHDGVRRGVLVRVSVVLLLDDESAHHPGRASVIHRYDQVVRGLRDEQEKIPCKLAARKLLEKWFVLMHLLLECLNAVISSYTCCTCS